MVILGQIVQFQYTPQILALLMWPRNLHLCSREDPELPDGFEEVDMYDFNTEEERVKEDEEEARQQEEREEQGATCGTQWFFLPLDVIFSNYFLPKIFQAVKILYSTRLA